jgi:hypothetical protein
MHIEQFAIIFGLGFAAGGVVIGRLIFWMDRLRYVRRG